MTDGVQKIIVADGDGEARAAVAAMVDQMGHAAIQASEASVTLKLLEDNPDVALVVLDMGMRGTGGRRLIEEIRANAAWQKLPAIVVSGVISITEVAGILELGPSYFVPKPVNREDLAEYVERTLRRRG